MPTKKRTKIATRAKVSPIIAIFLTLSICVIGVSIVFAAVVSNTLTIAPTFSRPTATQIKYHSADANKNYKIDQDEMNYVLALKKAGSYHCEARAFSGYAPGPGNQNCLAHSADYMNGGPDGKISNSELMRVIQFFNAGGYRVARGTEDNFAPIVPIHTADVNSDNKIDQAELDYVAAIQKSGTTLADKGAYHCDSTAYSGYAPGPGSHDCSPHSSDYQTKADWKISMSELLRLIQLYNSDGYRMSRGTEDGYAPMESFHAADVNKDNKISSDELNYVVTLQKVGAYHCDATAYSSYAAGPGNHDCSPHSSDYQNIPDWKISTSELLRVIQFSNADGYKSDPTTEDGFAPVVIYHSADVNNDYKISLDELNYVISLQTAGAYHCDAAAFSGYTPGSGSHSCLAHNSDYINGVDWKISTSEVLRLIQFYNSGGYKLSPGTEDGFAPLSD